MVRYLQSGVLKFPLNRPFDNPADLANTGKLENITTGWCQPFAVQVGATRFRSYPIHISQLPSCCSTNELHQGLGSSNIQRGIQALSVPRPIVWPSRTMGTHLYNMGHGGWTGGYSKPLFSDVYGFTDPKWFQTCGFQTSKISKIGILKCKRTSSLTWFTHQGHE